MIIQLREGTDEMTVTVADESVTLEPNDDGQVRVRADVGDELLERYPDVELVQDERDGEPADEGETSEGESGDADADETAAGEGEGEGDDEMMETLDATDDHGVTTGEGDGE